MEYQLTFHKNDKTLWTFSFEEQETIAGMIAVSVPILSEINSKHQERYYLNYPDSYQKYLKHPDIREDQIRQKSSVDKGYYGLWLKSDRDYCYNLYTFSSHHFVQGVISFALACEVDFRDYLYGVIFNHNHELYFPSNYENLFVSNSIDYVQYDLDTDLYDMDDENILAPGISFKDVSGDTYDYD